MPGLGLAPAQPKHMNHTSHKLINKIVEVLIDGLSAYKFQTVAPL
jgi:hypothetical protein